MDYQFITSTCVTVVVGGVNALGTYFTYRQFKLQADSIAKSKKARVTLVLPWKYAYGPTLAMALLVTIAWIPYFMGEPKIPDDLFLNYGFNGRIFAVFDTARLMSEKPKRLMIVAIISDNSTPYLTDTRIARSATFEIMYPQTVIEVDAPPVLQNRPGLVNIYALLVPEDFPFELIKNLADAKKLGGKILESRGFGGGIVVQSQQPHQP